MLGKLFAAVRPERMHAVCKRLKHCDHGVSHSLCLLSNPGAIVAGLHALLCYFSVLALGR